MWIDWYDMDTAPLDGREFLARWTATEHGNRYMVIYWVANQQDFFNGDIPVRCMDAWCELPQ